MKRKLLLFFAMLSVSIGMWAGPHDVTQDPNDATKFYIGEVNEGNYFTVVDGVVTFHVAKTKPLPPDQQGTGAVPETEDVINKAWNNIQGHLGGATRIKFDNACLITKEDLLRFLQDNKYYVDLFDITNGTNTPMQVDNYNTTEDDNNANNIDKIIEAAIDDMVTNQYQAKGIILPLNTGSGTSKVFRGYEKWSQKFSTFSEYALYYRDTQKTATIYSFDSQVQWEPNVAVTNAQDHYNTAYSHLSEHSLTGIKTMIVSSNNKNRIDLSNLSSLTSLTTKITIVNDEMVYVPTDRIANIYVETSEQGAFAAAVVNTGIKGTPCDQLVVEGTVDEYDVAAVNGFNSTDVEGPHVYNLAGATGVTKVMLSKMTNNKVEYVVLPYAMSTEKITASDFSSSMTSLKAAIAASSDKAKLSAYVKEAGSLGMARYYATGGTYNADNAPYYSASKVGVTDVILSGSLNASDLVTKIERPTALDDNGHFTSGQNSTNVMIGMDQEFGVASFDLEDAVFADQYDMNFWKAGYEKLTSVKLPTSSAMNIIPANCLRNMSLLTELCVPYNYEYIEDGAFWLTGINHMTTTDAAGAEVDNGPKTWTISANVKQLGITPTTEKAFVETIFPQNVGVEEIYCLAVKVPKCYANVFPANACYGWGGDDPQQPYCRDKYYNGGNKKEAWAILHFPSEESYNASAGTKESSYELLKRYYTDVNKKFTKKEQTGAVDANGDPIAWPTHWEGYRAYNQASFGYTWNDWEERHTATIEGHVNGGSEVNQQPRQGDVYTCPAMEADGGTGTGEGDYDFNDYIGWHQIVLALATYVEPDEKIEEEKIVREYELAGYYTFCIPFDMTVSQVQQMLGVPASAGNVICKLDGVEVTEPIMPEIRQLQSVTRKKGANGQNNVVTLRLTDNLWNGTKAQYLDFENLSGDGNGQKAVDAATEANPDRCLVGGRPYIIKAYRRAGNEYKIYGQNLGMAVMMRNSDAFGVEASCVTNGLYEQLGDGDLVTLRFAIPYENHKVQAVKDGTDATYLEYDVDGTAFHYNYTMVGQFWQQPLPQYCFYMSKGKWYRYTDTTKNYTWDPYKCIIMATPEIDDTQDHPMSGKYRDNAKSNYPEVEEGTTDLLKSNFYLGFLNGRDDDDFDQPYAANAKYVFTFDDGITEFDEDGNEVTAIESIDGEITVEVPGDGKVYNMSGQMVGKSVGNLGKGLYIVNGKKFVIR